MKINNIGFQNINIFHTVQKTVSFGIDNNKIIKEDNFEIKKPTIDFLKPSSVIRRETAKERQKLLTPITSKEEYENVLRKNFSLKYQPEDSILPKPYLSTEGYDRVDMELKGLVPYCGIDDRSDVINTFLSGRELPQDTTVSEKQIADIIRTMDYSLKKLDDKFGKYKGVVYRVGYFNPVASEQFYSTSANSIGAVRHAKRDIPSQEEPYSIIKVKNGHNLYQFQKGVNSFFAKRFAETEKEILIDRKAKFRRIPENEYTDTDIRLRNIMLTQALLKTDEINSHDIDNIVSSNQDLMEYISIWEEI